MRKILIIDRCSECPNMYSVYTSEGCQNKCVKTLLVVDNALSDILPECPLTNYEVGK